jgi:putative aminopeptidase FrvX
MPRQKAAAADLRRQARRADPLGALVPTTCRGGGRLRPSCPSRGFISRARRAGLLLALGGALCGAAHGGAPGHPAGRAGAARPAAATAPAGDPDRRLEAFLRVAAVAGREQPAAAFIREQLGRDLPVRSDALGNVMVTFGSRGPRRLVACALGEPGFVVSRIDGEGYLRLAAVGGAVPSGALWEQAHEGQLVWVAGARGAVPGTVAAPSIHELHGRQLGGRPFSTAEAFVDIGAQNPAEAAELGIQVNDTVALDRLPTRLAHGLVAGPSARVKAACLAAVEAARRFRATPRTGTVVFAWTTGDLLGRAGILHLLRRRGPFSELVVLGRELGWQRYRGREQAVRLPAPGTGLLAGGALAGALPGLQPMPFLEPRLSPGEALLYPASTGYLGLPALNPGTPVETVAVADVQQLATVLLTLLGGARAAAAAAPASSARSTSPDSAAPPAPPPASPPPAPPAAAVAKPAPAAAAPRLLPLDGEARHAETGALLATLVAPSGVSGAEAPVRDAILHQLPPWAHPVVDWAGNLAVTFGGPAAAQAPDPGSRLFMAHMDEVGFQVSEVLADGRLKLWARGGLLRTLWEAHAALIQGRRGPVPAVIEPRPRWHGDLRRASADELTAFLGAAGAAEVAALGIRVGSTVTLPKAMLRLGRHRVAAGSLDDRAGAAALLLALRRIHPAALRHRVTFAWTTREEVGFLGAAALAQALPGPRRVYPVDVYASSDSPRESRQPAAAALGHGAVLGAAGSGLYASRAVADHVLALGRQRGIALQLATTVGPTDGIPFLAGGASVLPLSWAGRYSHAPVEVADLRDVEALVDLVVALAGE